MKWIDSKVIKIISLIATGILFVIPYVDKRYSNNFILVLSGITLTIYIVSAVLEERKKRGHW